MSKAFGRDTPILPVIAAIFFVITFAIKAFTDGLYVRGEISSTVAYSKYATALIACVAALAYAIGHGEHMFVREFNELSVLVVAFTLGSATLQALHGAIVSTVWIEIIKFSMPIFLAYCMLNALDEKQVKTCMMAVLVVSLVGYLYDLSATGVSFSSIFSADFSTSTSATESSGFAETALMLTFYFAFAGDRKPLLVVSTIFCLLTFKRLGMLFAVIALAMSLFAPKLMGRKVPKGVATALKLFTLGATALWFWMLLPEQEGLFFDMMGQTPFEFTSGRSNIMRFLLDSGFESYGFGSTNDTVAALFGVPFEMDFVKIAIELTPLALVLFVWVFWNLAGTSLWGYLVVSYFVLNMITSDSLTANFSFTLAYMVLGTVGAHFESKERGQMPIGSKRGGLHELLA